MVGFFKNHVADSVGCIFIDGIMGQFFALSLGVDDLRCNRFGSICGNAYFAV